MSNTYSSCNSIESSIDISLNALENNQSFANFSVEEKLNEYCENNKDDIEGIKEAKKLASKQIEEK